MASPPILFYYVHLCFLHFNLVITYWAILILDTWSFDHFVLCGEYWVVSLFIEIFVVHLFLPHELLWQSMLFKMLAPRFLVVIDQICCATIVFVFDVWIGGWWNRRLTLGTHFLRKILDGSPLVCFNFFFSFYYSNNEFLL